MVDFISYFFRGQEDGYVFQIFGCSHIALLIVFLLGVFIIARSQWTEKTWHFLLKISVGLLFTDQILIYLWQFLSGYFRMDISLPLYHCRIAVWLLMIAVVYKNRMAKIIGIYWGLIGSFGAMLLPDPYKFQFPHYTGINYFLVHMIMGWIITYFLFVEDFHINQEDNKRAFIYINLYNIFLYGVNKLLSGRYPQVNYGYMMKMPDFIGIKLPEFAQALLIILLFNLLMLLSFVLVYSLQKRMGKN